MNHLLSFQGITAGYGGRDVVMDATFGVPSGEFCALLGLNGSGKTTLLKAVCGLLPLKSGKCLVGGMDAARLDEYRRARYISYIPQRLSAQRGVGVLDYVLMGLHASLGALAHPSPEDRASAADTLRKVGIGHLAAEDFSRLSEGQKQMAVLARALLQNTPVMLMDEPDSSLDFLNRHLLMDMFRKLVHSEGKAALVTLHDPNLALSYCDRIVLLNGGRIVSVMPLPGAGADEVASCLSVVYGDAAIAIPASFRR